MLRPPLCLAASLMLVLGAASALAEPVPVGVGGLPRMGSEDDAKTANELGLNEEAFSACLESGAKRAEVEDNMRLAEAAGVTEVPTVFINGDKVEEDELLSLQSYIEIIEDLLAR